MSSLLFIDRVFHFSVLKFNPTASDTYFSLCVFFSCLIIIVEELYQESKTNVTYFS